MKTAEIDLLKTAEALMDLEDDEARDPGFAGIRQRRVRHILDTRIALLIGFDIARSLRDIRWSLERLAQFQQERQ